MVQDDDRYDDSAIVGHCYPRPRSPFTRGLTLHVFHCRFSLMHVRMANSQINPKKRSNPPNPHTKKSSSCPPNQSPPTTCALLRRRPPPARELQSCQLFQFSTRCRWRFPIPPPLALDARRRRRRLRIWRPAWRRPGIALGFVQLGLLPAVWWEPTLGLFLSVASSRLVWSRPRFLLRHR